MAEPVRCGKCRAELDEPMNVPLDERQPCPRCGSRSRLYSQTLTARATATASLVPAFVGATAAAGYAVARIMQRPPSPEPGYHFPHKHGDVVGESILVGLAAAGLVGVARGVRRRWGTFRP
jgi:hypothetical protein